ncbi:hypothetical protein SARC_13691 [Sphaeroforma arctica JP610]|uniref:Uncharacterized protein n=1 Tax=Sphaeroforma arctica JP610 TaxID=667725 RepID=A0A0L0FAL2_9EUKA|nr:hypothetical protein SARC_13691 [Sphaeroforma arctica JP610]KNC73752.1 hypothetical protein SARC_13691 [Sphaeroforma arctica JP610]|eukprot:XP_014147654.1 hypothetical protein SARC_13691 [Sphaeroforma arctica JP610]
MGSTKKEAEEAVKEQGSVVEKLAEGVAAGIKEEVGQAKDGTKKMTLHVPPAPIPIGKLPRL